MARVVKNNKVLFKQTQLLFHGSELLKVPSKPVEFPLNQEINDVLDDLQHAIRNVQGFWSKKSMAISAPQIGKHHRIFLICAKKYWYHPYLMYKNFHNFINPEILEYSNEKIEVWEGCVSNNDHIYLVERPKDIVHELDHLNGIQMEDIGKKQYPISQLIEQNDYDKFYDENKDHILED
ncbi:UNKNOWN [Stylonychia lemnae]|uniref:Peptide deformylase n=1 Tax=Stylonychia lemnae TaxID=5949 RepID=A0A078ATI7_STYLE|nr:UNKNOWN [Stylonychia lemnae]|eukprot:CDW84502.1 UNKNOWN [Stylonychia lemnae]